MTPQDAPIARSITIERDLAHPPDKVWRALTQPHMIAEWLMENDFALQVGHHFSLNAGWGAVRCEVLAIEHCRALSYTWGDDELKTVVSWTLDPSEKGTLLRMEQTGFKSDQPRYFHGAKAGWPRFLDALAKLLDRLD